MGGDHGDMACILGQVEASRDNRNSNSNNSKARKNNQLKWQKAELTTACLKCARQSFLPACLPVLLQLLLLLWQRRARQKDAKKSSSQAAEQPRRRGAEHAPHTADATQPCLRVFKCDDDDSSKQISQSRQ